jgi:4-diphosphocytidyl-2C-methyl-D-erythritol kinase
MIEGLDNNGRGDIPLYNIFEQVISIDEINKIKEIMTKNEAEYTLMSGSGPAVFGKFSDSNCADRACITLSENGFTAFKCCSVYPEDTL